MRYFVSMILIAIMAAIAFGQTEPRTISGGVVNGKATKLVRPSFPAAARAVRACGAVNVQVTIDIDGNVAEASSVSGHPLLRAAAVAAAKASAFSPTYLSGQPVRITGVIVYNFACPMSELAIGYDLSQIERGGTGNRGALTIADYLPGEWTEIQDRLKELAREMANLNSSPTALANQAKDAPIRGSANMGDSEKIKQIARGLIEAIEEKFESGGEARWSFLIGVRAARVVEDSPDPIKLATAIAELEEEYKRAPADAAEYRLNQIRDLLDAAKSAQPATDSRSQLAEKAAALLI